MTASLDYNESPVSRSLVDVSGGETEMRKVEEVLERVVLFTDDCLYRFVRLPPADMETAKQLVAEARCAFFALLRDKDEVTLMIEEGCLQRSDSDLTTWEVSDIPYRLITFDLELEPGLVGFMARISTALAGEGISVMPFAAFSRDHIFVGDDDFEKAVEVLGVLTGRNRSVPGRNSRE